MLTNDIYRHTLKRILEGGAKVTCRTHDTLELSPSQVAIPMDKPLVTLGGRKLGYKFACAEAAWILSGDNKVSTIAPYSRMISKFSDDGISFFGAYGPKIVDQLEYIGRCFNRDLNTRQAILTIWREKPPVSNDIPCTISIQFLVRNGRLNVIDTMRSSDTWLGVPYDWNTFSMLAAYVCLYLREAYSIDLEVGTLFLIAGSQHVYSNSFGYSIQDVERVCYAKIEDDFTYERINLREFRGPSDLVNHLKSLAEGRGGLKHISYLRELNAYWQKKEVQKRYGVCQGEKNEDGN